MVNILTYNNQAPTSETKTQRCKCSSFNVPTGINVYAFTMEFNEGYILKPYNLPQKPVEIHEKAWKRNKQ